MRVVIVGATGNAGTALLKALKDTPEVTSVLGIARRLPDRSLEPYAACEWEAIDIAAAVDEDEAVSELTSAFTGADAVIHLAWLIQPNTHRELLRRVNVEGTAHVARAAAAANVPHLVVASSVGAYSPDKRHGSKRTEEWPVEGVSSSHYSVDKAAQERVLDKFSADHPEVVVTRMRPALTFQPEAASEIQRYFLSRWIPVRGLKYVRLPFLPVPKGLRGMQAIHADDLGRAYASAVVKRAPGAFNICADDILGPKCLADILDHGRYVELPRRFVRALIFGAHRAKLVAADEGWLDMALAAPMMNNLRAKTELDWAPRHSAADALQGLVRGMADGAGAGSVPMRPRDADRAHLESVDRADIEADAGDVTNTATSPGKPAISRKISRGLLGLYLSDHLTGATAGAERMERMSAAYIDTPVYARLSETAEQLRLERTFLRNLIHDLGFRQRGYRQAVAWVAERFGRLKGNGRVLSRSPMTLVLETELMRSAVAGKLGLWQTLEANAGELSLDPEVFADLATGAQDQASVLQEVHEYARERAFRTDRSTFTPRTQNDS